MRAAARSRPARRSDAGDVAALFAAQREHLAPWDPRREPGFSTRAGQCARLAAQWGYDEININIGCPSERVQRGSFGACLMAEPDLVADCVRAMREASSLPVTVKHRTGVDRSESYEFMRDFVAKVES